MTTTTTPLAPGPPVEALWARLVSVALVGTERKPPPVDALSQVAALVDDADGEELGILDAAGAVATYRRVGLVVAHSDAPLPDAAPPDARAEASAIAAQLLQLLLEGHVRVLGGPTALVEEWLARCAASGHRPPARLLPALLDHATRVLALRPAVVAAGSPRARWLAGHNPAWEWATEADRTASPAAPAHGHSHSHGPDGQGPGSGSRHGQGHGPDGQRPGSGGRDSHGLGQGDGRGSDSGSDGHGGHRPSDDEVWRTGAPAARMALLAARRRDDPTRALTLVEDTWSGETAKDRAQILEVLRTNLSLDDERFLEACLDDRAPSVRAAAADVLASLPGSQLGRRMADRLRPLITQRATKVEVTLPDGAPDAAARRDGIVDTGAPPATGRRTWWLIQLVGATPLPFWTGELGLTPADAVRHAKQAELVEGWVLAASRRHGDPSWCRELLRVAPDPRLLRALAPDQAHDLLPVALERAADPAVAGLLVATPAPWPPLLSQWVVHRLRANRNAVAVDRSLTRLAAAGDAAVIPDLERWIDELGPHDRLRTTLRDVVHGLSIRHTIAQELS